MEFFYKITYSVNDKNERVYPKKMKGVVFSLTQDHASEHFMVGKTNSEIAADGKAIIALKPDEAEALIKELQQSYPEPEAVPPVPAPGVEE